MKAVAIFVALGTALLCGECSAFTNLKSLQLSRSANTAAVIMSRTEVSAPSGPAGLQKWDPSAQQVWIKPALHNANPVRVAVLIAATSAAARGSKTLLPNLAKFLHVLAFAVWIGSSFWTTFFAGITMFRNLPRQTFGRLQSKLFPQFFALNAVCIGVTAATLGASSLQGPAGSALAVALVANLANMFVLEPRSTTIMLKRYDMEDAGTKESDEYKMLAKKFGALHGMSSLANLGALVAGFVYTWRLAAGIAL